VLVRHQNRGNPGLLQRDPGFPFFWRSS
jgi:hypothetical protein